MNILNTLAPVGAPNGSAVALGYFDGVHLGHRRVLGAAVEYAAAHGLTPAAFTFSLPGGQSLKGGRILSAGQKHARVAALGITAYMEPPFESFRSLSPEDFVGVGVLLLDLKGIGACECLDDLCRQGGVLRR